MFTLIAIPLQAGIFSGAQLAVLAAGLGSLVTERKDISDNASSPAPSGSRKGGGKEVGKDVGQGPEDSSPPIPDDWKDDLLRATQVPPAGDRTVHVYTNRES